VRICASFVVGEIEHGGRVAFGQDHRLALFVLTRVDHRDRELVLVDHRPALGVRSGDALAEDAGPLRELDGHRVV
jgi:hypothetical protein